jgi:hypothetical protein
MMADQEPGILSKRGSEFLTALGNWPESNRVMKDPHCTADSEAAVACNAKSATKY